MLDAKPLLLRYLNEGDLEAIALTVANAYPVARDLMASSIITSLFPIGAEHRPHFIRIAVEYCLMRLADERAEFTHEIRWNAAENCKHLRIFKNKLAMTSHFVGQRNFRTSARTAVCREPLAARNTGDLFGYSESDLQLFDDFGYAQILHGGGAAVEVLSIVIPQRDQRLVGARADLPLLKPRAIQTEVIREELLVQWKKAEEAEDLDNIGWRNEGERNTG